MQRDLVTANHILHLYGAVDGFGHVSVRHPENPKVYIMCGYIPPALVEGVDDLIEYWTEGSDPVNPNAKKGYSERFIHGEMYRRYSSVQCVVHSHAEAVIPYVVSDVRLLPVYHMGGFLQGEVPVWDPAPLYDDHDRQDMLVNTQRLGASLAEAFGQQTGTSAGNPQWNVVLMKRHGYTTFGKDIATACYRAVYTLINAGIQTNATLLQATVNESSGDKTMGIQGLSERHARDCQIMTEATQDKSWRLWSREVEASPLYRNSVL